MIILREVAPRPGTYGNWWLYATITLEQGDEVITPYNVALTVADGSEIEPQQVSARRWVTKSGKIRGPWQFVIKGQAYRSWPIGAPR